jgi:putative heme iron utilization protein
MVDEGGELRALVQAQPIAALGTLHAGDDGIEPFVSMVPVAWRPASAQALIHVSRLAPHTRDLLAASRVSLMLVAPRQPGDNPLALARLSLQCSARPLSPGSDEAAEARAIYLARFPEAEQTVVLEDFFFVCLQPRSARHVAGFGRARHLTAQALAAALAA